MTECNKPATLLLKWGNVKGWSGFKKGSKSFDLLQEYLFDSPASCMFDNPDEQRETLLCSLIREFDGTIWNDWSGDEMTKDEAVNYVMNYGNERRKS